jgi:hypothetical protein
MPRAAALYAALRSRFGYLPVSDFARACTAIMNLTKPNINLIDLNYIQTNQ